MNEYKSVNRTIILNVLSIFLGKGAGFIAIPIFTRIMSLSEYGLYSIINSWMLFIPCFIGLGVNGSLAAGHQKYSNNYLEFRNNSLVLSTICGFIIAGILIPIFSNIYPFRNYGIFFTLVGLMCAIGRYIVSFAQDACVYEVRPVLNLIISILIALVATALSVVLALFSVDKVAGRYYGLSIGYAITSIVICLIFLSETKFTFNWDYCRYSIVIGFPIIFHSIAGIVLNQSDRLMLQSFGVDVAEIGIYSFYYSLQDVLLVILSALNKSWIPLYYSYLNKSSVTGFKQKIRNYIEVFAFIVIIYVFVFKEICIVMGGKDYLKGLSLAPILVFSAWFTFMYQFPVNYEFFYGKTKIIALGTTVASVINILLNLVFIPKFGIIGAALSTTLSYCFLFFVHYYAVNHFKGISYDVEVFPFIKTGLVVVLAVILANALKDYFVIRWSLAVVYGFYELMKIIKRRSIF